MFTVNILETIQSIVIPHYFLKINNTIHVHNVNEFALGKTDKITLMYFDYCKANMHI